MAYMEIAVEVFTAFLEEHDMEIILVVFGQQSVKISGVQDEESFDEVVSDEAVTEDKDVLSTSGSSPDRLPMAASIPGFLACGNKSRGSYGRCMYRPPNVRFLV